MWEEISADLGSDRLRSRQVNSRAYVAPFQFMLLDEPTNDLDVNQLRALEEHSNNSPAGRVS